MADLTAHTIKPKGDWTGPPADRVVLSFDDRFRRRILLTGENGTKILLSLKDAKHLHTGDALEAEDGSLIEVVAAAEKLIEIRCESPMHLLRVAWHLGNRHLPTQIEGSCVRIRYDKVILEMVQGLGADASIIEAPFDPEGGAYGGHTRVHSHDHGHAHDHTKEHSHEH